MTGDDQRRGRTASIPVRALCAAWTLAWVLGVAVAGDAASPRPDRPADEPEAEAEAAAGGIEPRPAVDRVVGGFDRTSRWVTGGLVVGLGGVLAFADTDDIRSLGDVTQFVPGVAALGVAFGVGDRQGVRQLGLSAGTAFVATHGLKELVEKTRPDDTADNSFPSGHTAASFTGAAFLWRRYGPRWGAPASVIAAYTGVSRVVGQNHFADDVVSGAAIGLISNWLWTDPIDDRVRMALFPVHDGAGVSVSIDPTAAPAREAGEIPTSPPSRLFVWEFGGADVVRNDLAVDGGPEFDFRFDRENNPTATAFVGVAWVHPDSGLAVYGAFAPFEVRETLAAGADVVVPGAIVPDGTEVRSRYVANDYRVGAGIAAIHRPRVQLLLGGSVGVFDTSVRLATQDARFEEHATVVRPIASARLGATLGKRWILFSAIHWWSDSAVELTDASAQVGFRPHEKWIVTLGYRWVHRAVEDDGWSNVVERNQTAIGIAYLW